MINIEHYDKKIDFIKVNNGCNLEFVFSNYGASLYTLNYDGQPIVLTLEDKEIFLKNPNYFGKTLGIVAGRLKCHGFLYDQEYNLLDTGHDICLHGGDAKSLSYKKWKYDIKENDKYINVIFKIKTKDGENGFLGSASIKIIYKIYKNKDKFNIIFKGKILKDCLMNLSNHIYWNFDCSKNLDEYSLKMNCDRVAIMDDNLLHLGFEDVPAYLDFNNMKLLKNNMTFIERNLNVGTIDNTFLFKCGENPKVVLKNKEYTLTMKTNYPAMNIYVDNSLIDYKFKNMNGNFKRRGIALEPQLFGFNKDSISFEKGDTYNYKIEYSIKRNGK